MNLLQFKQNLENININELIDDTVVETGDKILNHNRTQMLFGKNTRGDDLGYYKWPEYAEDKANYFADYHAPYGVYNYSKFGDFHNAMYVRPLLTAIEVGSTDSKEGYLEDLAGGADNVFGLTDENIETYRHDEFKPKFIFRLLNAMTK